MIIRLIIIGVIIAAGGILFFPDTINPFIDKISAVDAVTDDIEDLKNDAQNDIDKTITEIGNKIDEIKATSSEILLLDLPKDETVVFGQVYEKTDDVCLVSVPDMVQTINGKTELTHILKVEDCQFNEDDLVVVEEIMETELDEKLESINIEPEVIIKPVSSSHVFETLQLKTTQQQDDDVVIQYEDSSGKTISVTITLRNSERELFSGIFYTSKFETFVNDLPDEPHVIEMIVDHAEHGLILSSVYKPAGSYDNIINGVFIKS